MVPDGKCDSVYALESPTFLFYELDAIQMGARACAVENWFLSLPFHSGFSELTFVWHQCKGFIDSTMIA